MSRIPNTKFTIYQEDEPRARTGTKTGAWDRRIEELKAIAVPGKSYVVATYECEPVGNISYLKNKFGTEVKFKMRKVGANLWKCYASLGEGAK